MSPPEVRSGAAAVRSACTPLFRPGRPDGCSRGQIDVTRATPGGHRAGIRSQWCCENRGGSRDTRERLAALPAVRRACDRDRSGRQAGADPCRGASPPRPAGPRRPRRGASTGRPTARSDERGRGRPAKVFTPHRGRSRLLRAGLRRPGRRTPCDTSSASLGADAVLRLRAGPGRRARGARTPRGRRCRTRGPAAGLAAALTAEGFAASATPTAAGAPALPAPLPGRARRRGVPRSCARPRRRRSPSCSAPTSSAWPPSLTATTSAPRSSRTCTGAAPEHGPPERTASMTAIDAHRARRPRPLRVRLVRLRCRRRQRAPRTVRGRRARTSRRSRTSPQWMLDLRLKGLRLFEKKPMPTWGSDLSGIHFDTIKYFVRSTEKQAAILGGPARRHQEHLRPPRHPRGREAAPRVRAWPRSTSPRSSTTRSARTSRSRASSSSTPTRVCASTRTSSASTSPR